MEIIIEIFGNYNISIFFQLLYPSYSIDSNKLCSTYARKIYAAVDQKCKFLIAINKSKKYNNNQPICSKHLSKLKLLIYYIILRDNRVCQKFNNKQKLQILKKNKYKKT